MFGYDPYYLGGAVIGGVFGIYLFSVLFRYALLGPSGTKIQQMWIVLLTGIVAIGFSAFGEGADGFLNRITNPPNPVQIFAYSFSALLVAFFVWWRVKDTPTATATPKKASLLGRAIAIVFVIPIMAVGFGNIGGNIYSLAVAEPELKLKQSASRAEMRNIMLTGDLAPFWQVVNERAPEDMNFIIERIFAQESGMHTVDQGRQVLTDEVVQYRVSLALYASALDDQQRKNILQTNLEMLRAFEDRPHLCLDLAMTGGRNLTQAELLSARDLLNRNLVVMTESLLDARQQATKGTSVPIPPNEQDYAALVRLLYDRGLSEDQMQALFNEDSSHPQFCQIQISFLDALIDLGGTSGEAIRGEILSAMLVAKP